MEYYKKIDKSLFYYGITILSKDVAAFTFNRAIQPGNSRPVRLKWKRKIYDAKLCHINRQGAKPVHQLRWDSNGELQIDLRKEFIQTYLAIESENYAARVARKYYRTHLGGGNQEVLIFRPISSKIIEIETFIRIPTQYDNIFRRLIEENVFGWLNTTRKEYVITKATHWLDIRELPKHQDANFVIYYLVDERKKEIYIGSAKRLGDRVKPGRKEIPGWSKFKYEIIHPNFHHLLRELEHHSIRSFAGFFKNKARKDFFCVSAFRLTNKNWSRRQ